MLHSHYLDCHLVNKYFGGHIKALNDAHSIVPYSGRFFLLAENSANFEGRLARIEKWGQTSSIIREVGGLSKLESLVKAISLKDGNSVKNLKDFCEELDRRLMDAWAELRTIDLLAMEGFTKIEKVIETADFIACCQTTKYAFQVKRINKSLLEQVEKRNDPDQRNMEPSGTLTDIHQRFSEPLSYMFWDALLEKNSKYKNYQGSNRCIVIVSGDEDLQDPLLKHIACQRIRSGIYDQAFGKRNFEYLLWLPDISPGAWFIFDEQQSRSRCFADWKDEIGTFGWEENISIYRREVDLNSRINSWEESQEIFSLCSQA